MEQSALMEILSRLADIEAAVEEFVNYDQFDMLARCLNDAAYDGLWERRFPIKDKYELWNLAQLEKDIQLEKLRPYTQFGFRCGKKSTSAAAPCISLVYACRGDVECETRDEYFQIKEHEVCVVNSGTLMNLCAAGNEGYYVTVFLNKLYLNNVLIRRFPSDSRFTPFFEQALFGAEHGLDYLIFDTNNAPRARYYFQTLIETFLLQPNCHEEIESSLLFLFICELMVLWDNRQVPRQPENAAITAYDIISYITANYRDVTLASISEYFHFHPDTMRKLIKRLMNKNFIDLVKDVRMARACEQLRATSLPVTEIIAACGYQNTSHFYTLFKEKYKCSPAEYRENKRNGV